jgi:hypothetical protein
MKIIILLFTLVASIKNTVGQHSLTKLWDTDTSLKVPESVLFDAKNGILYVSNIIGEPWKKDSIGSIAILSTNGSIKNPNWISGLHAPKGMAKHRKKMYVADIDRVVVINVRKGKIKKIIPIAGATHLNDVALGKKGLIYVSESKNRAVYTIEKGQYIKKLLDSTDLKRPNGLHVANGLLHILDDGKLIQVQKDKTLKTIASGMDGGTDGIESVNNGDYLVTCWAGAIWYVAANGEKQILLDTRAAKLNTADLGINKAEKIIYVPGFFSNKVTAYKVVQNKM